MIYDRPYMRDPNPAKELAPLLWLAGVLVGCFAVQFALEAFAGDFTTNWLALTPNGIAHGRVWTLLTYSLLHSTTDLWHLIGNIIGLLVCGRLLLPVTGTRRFLWAYAGAVVAGGLLWLAVNFTRGTPLHQPELVGASAGVYGIFSLFCCRFAFERIQLLLFFIVPVSIVPRYALIAVTAVVTLFFIFGELFGAPTGIAHSAHLGGIIAGIIAHRALSRNPFEETEEEEQPRQAVELPAWMKKKSALPAAPSTKVNLSPRENLKAEVDRILDKINISGFGSLTPEEKRTLDAARNLMTKQ